MSSRIDVYHLKGDLLTHAIRRRGRLEHKFPKDTSIIVLSEYQSELSDRRKRVILGIGLVIFVFFGGLIGINVLLGTVGVGWSETTAVLSNLAFTVLITVSFSWLQVALWGRSDDGPQTLTAIKAEEEIVRLMMQESMP